MSDVDAAREALLDIPATQAAFRGAFFAQAVDALIAAVRAEHGTMKREFMDTVNELAALREAVLDNIEAFPGSDLCRYCQNLLSDGHSFDCVVVKARAVLAATPAEEERT